MAGRTVHCEVNMATCGYTFQEISDLDDHEPLWTSRKSSVRTTDAKLRALQQHQHLHYNPHGIQHQIHSAQTTYQYTSK